MNIEITSLLLIIGTTSIALVLLAFGFAAIFHLWNKESVTVGNIVVPMLYIISASTLLSVNVIHIAMYAIEIILKGIS